MLSRREKLLISPWQQRRYENHLKKVKQALPVIDNRPPQDRTHVWNKLKKQQLESERCAKIEKDNLTLLRKMNDIMKTRRVDHFWTTPPPSFLNRVTKYDNIVPTEIDDSEYIFEDLEDYEGIKHLRKLKCRACTPREIKEIILPEERIPWEPIKLKKCRSKSVPPKLLPKLTDSTKVSKSKSASHGERQKSRNDDMYQTDSSDKSNNLSQSITITSGCLNLAVKFPPNTTVKYFDGPNEKIISGSLCYYRNKDAE